MLSLYLFFLSHIEKITTWQDPRKPMSQPLNHVSHHPAATSTPAPQRSMAMSQPNLSEYWWHLSGGNKRDRRDTSSFVWFMKVALILLSDLTVCSPVHLVNFPLCRLGSRWICTVWGEVLTSHALFRVSMAVWCSVRHSKISSLCAFCSEVM